MTVTQKEFRAALLDAGQPVPDGLLAPGDAPAGARFSVYRNNVVLSLTEALETAFPLVRKLLGAENFKRLAAVFVRKHPPSSPLMMFYGEDLPELLESFEPLREIGYLADCARLDLALRQSYHAADATSLDAKSFQLDPVAALGQVVSLAPATQVLRSTWPLHDIWRFNMEPGAEKPRAVAQEILIARSGFDPRPHLLPLGGADWLDFLARGLPLGQASEDVLARRPDFDLTATLSLVLSTGALTEFTTKES
jgi:hypothetical protein